MLTEDINRGLEFHVRHDMLRCPISNKAPVGFDNTLPESCGVLRTSDANLLVSTKMKDKLWVGMGGKNFAYKVAAQSCLDVDYLGDGYYKYTFNKDYADADNWLKIIDNLFPELDDSTLQLTVDIKEVKFKDFFDTHPYLVVGVNNSHPTVRIPRNGYQGTLKATWNLPDINRGYIMFGYYRTNNTYSFKKGDTFTIRVSVTESMEPLLPFIRRTLPRGKFMYNGFRDWRNKSFMLIGTVEIDTKNQSISIPTNDTGWTSSCHTFSLGFPNSKKGQRFIGIWTLNDNLEWTVKGFTEDGSELSGGIAYANILGTGTLNFTYYDTAQRLSAFIEAKVWSRILSEGEKESLYRDFFESCNAINKDDIKLAIDFQKSLECQVTEMKPYELDELVPSDDTSVRSKNSNLVAQITEDGYFNGIPTTNLHKWIDDPNNHYTNLYCTISDYRKGDGWVADFTTGPNQDWLYIPSDLNVTLNSEGKIFTLSFVIDKDLDIGNINRVENISKTKIKLGGGRYKYIFKFKNSNDDYAYFVLHVIDNDSLEARPIRFSEVMLEESEIDTPYVPNRRLPTLMFWKMVFDLYNENYSIVQVVKGKPRVPDIYFYIAQGDNGQYISFPATDFVLSYFHDDKDNILITNVKDTFAELFVNNVRVAGASVKITGASYEDSFMFGAGNKTAHRYPNFFFKKCILIHRNLTSKEIRDFSFKDIIIEDGRVFTRPKHDKTLEERCTFYIDHGEVTDRIKNKTPKGYEFITCKDKGYMDNVVGDCVFHINKAPNGKKGLYLGLDNINIADEDCRNFMIDSNGVHNLATGEINSSVTSMIPCDPGDEITASYDLTNFGEECELMPRLRINIQKNDGSMIYSGMRPDRNDSKRYYETWVIPDDCYRYMISLQYYTGLTTETYVNDIVVSPDGCPSPYVEYGRRKQGCLIYEEMDLSKPFTLHWTRDKLNKANDVSMSLSTFKDGHTVRVHSDCKHKLRVRDYSTVSGWTDILSGTGDIISNKNKSETWVYDGTTLKVYLDGKFVDQGEYDFGTTLWKLHPSQWANYIYHDLIENISMFDGVLNAGEVMELHSREGHLDIESKGEYKAIPYSTPRRDEFGLINDFYSITNIELYELPLLKGHIAICYTKEGLVTIDLDGDIEAEYDDLEMFYEDYEDMAARGIDYDTVSKLRVVDHRVQVNDWYKGRYWRLRDGVTNHPYTVKYYKK